MNFGKVYEGGVLVAFIKSGNIQITNNISTDEFVIGSPYRVCATEGKREITGTIEVLFQDFTMYNKFKQGEESSIKFELNNGTEYFSIYAPAVRFSGETPTIQDDTGITLTMNFTARYLDSEETDLVITLINSIATV